MTKTNVVHLLVTKTNVVHLLPNWPSVRCVACDRIFEVGAMPRRCPTCAGSNFVCKMDGLLVEMSE